MAHKQHVVHLAVTWKCQVPCHLALLLQYSPWCQAGASVGSRMYKLMPWSSGRDRCLISVISQIPSHSITLAALFCLNTQVLAGVSEVVRDGAEGHLIHAAVALTCQADAGRFQA